MKKQKPVKLFTLDTETYNGLFGGLKRIAIYDGNKVIYGYTFEEIEVELLKYYNLGYEVHVYIHNIEVDAMKLPAIFTKDRIDWSGCVVINGKLTTIKCKKYINIINIKCPIGEKNFLPYFYYTSIQLVVESPANSNNF